MMTSADDPAGACEELLAIEAIKRLKSRYAASADSHDWERFVALFTPDAVFDEGTFPPPQKPFAQEPASAEITSYLKSFGSGVEWPLIGREAILAQHVGVSPDHKMAHHLFNPEIQVTSKTTAAATFRFESHHWFPRGGTVHYMHNFGAYHDTYVKLEDGTWYISTLRLERRRVECS